MGTSETAVLGGGCFWCLEAVYNELRGVEHVISGYAGGSVPNPSYEAVCGGRTGHAEVVHITFDPEVLSYREILEVFFTVHDPTTLNRQGADVGTQYRSIILYSSPEQEATARSVIEETNATSASTLVLIDMTVIAFANAMRVQSMIGNTALLIETEMFGQPTLRAKWKKEYGGRPDDLQGLAVEEHVARLRDKLLPLVEKSHRIARESIEAISRIRQGPSMAVERAEAVNIVLVAPGSI